MSNPNQAFELRIKLDNRPGSAMCIIRAYDHNWSLADTHGRIDVEVQHRDVIVFPLGQLYCAVSKACGDSSDGIAAKELVMSLVAMHPSAGGGEGAEYYASYTPAQLEWCEAHGEAIDMERLTRYCDEEGNLVRASRRPSNFRRSLV